MSDTPRLSAEQRYEAEVLLERIWGDEDEARHFVFKTLYELAEAKRDAERYRWLRNRHYKGGMLGVWRETKDGVAIVDGWLSGADLDKAIDGAMKEGK